MPVISRTPWEFFDAYPPPYCRLFAKEEGSGKCDMSVTDTEIAIRSGIPLSRVREISVMENWSAVSFDEVRRFVEACKFDPSNASHRYRVKQYERLCTKRKSTPFHYLRLSPKWESEFLPLLILVNRIMKSRSALSLAATASATPQRS